MRLSKTSKKNTQRLKQILKNLKESQFYLLKENTKVCSTYNDKNYMCSKNYKGNFWNSESECLSPINKEVGSDLAKLHSGIYDLENFIFLTEKRE